MERLLAYLELHCVACSPQGDKIVVWTHYGEDGRWWVQPELIDATVKAVKDYLGY